MTPLLLLASASASADCPAPQTRADLLADLDQAEAAYADLDLDGFRAAVQQVRDRVPCADGALPPHLAASIHRLEGLLGFVDRAPDRSVTAFAAARAIEPNYRFPESLVPADNPVLADYGRRDPDSGRTMRIAAPASGQLLFDGTPSLQRPRDFPTLVQRLDDEGAVTATAYLWPDQVLPAYDARPAVAALPPEGRPLPLVEPRAPRVAPLEGDGGISVHPHRGLLIGAGASSVLAALLYGGASAVHHRYHSLDTPPEALDGLRTANSSLLVGSGAAAVAAVGLGASAFLVARF